LSLIGRGAVIDTGDVAAGVTAIDHRRVADRHCAIVAVWQYPDTGRADADTGDSHPADSSRCGDPGGTGSHASDTVTGSYAGTGTTDSATEVSSRDRARCECENSKGEDREAGAALA
jgi:hypothetical protein